MNKYADKYKNPKWQKKRLEILQRDEFSCRFCGDDKSMLHVHHIAYKGEIWEQDNELLITLCESCHTREELALKRESFELIKNLRSLGFTANSISSLAKVFEKDRGWMFYEPAFDILKLAVDEDQIWETIETLFWQLLKEKRNDRLRTF